MLRFGWKPPLRASIKLRQPLPSMPHVDTIIIGAGMAGISAAAKLASCAHHSFLLLEGSTSVGGRIQTIPWTPGGGTAGSLRLNVGAHWIAGDAPGHPLRSLLPRTSTTGRCKVTNFDDVPIFDPDGKLADYDWEPLTQAFERVAELPGDPQMSTLDGLAAAGWHAQTPADRVAQWFIIDFEWGTPAAQTALQHTVPSPYSAAYGSEDQLLVATRGGCTDLLAPLLAAIPPDTIRLGQTVASIRDKGSCLQVTTTDIEGAQSDHTASSVVLTASLGVLASGAIAFDPPLPDAKARALARHCQAHMATYEVVLMEFPRPFWAEASQGAMCWLFAGEPMVMIHDLMPYYQTPILEFHFAGQDAARISGQPIEQTEAEIMVMLRKMYGAGVPQPMRAHCTNWMANPLTKGSFSVRPLGMTDSEHASLAEPCFGGRLIFAGDGMHPQHSGYMHGAHLSGLAAAELAQAAVGKDAGKAHQEVPEAQDWTIGVGRGKVDLAW